MKQLTFSSLLLCAFTFTLFSSCKEKKKEPENNNVPATEVVQPTVPNTIITTPENMVVIIHKVMNYAKWKQHYDAHDSSRLKNGLHNYVIGRGLVDSNMVIVALRADDMAKAKAFANSADLKKVMQKGGVTGAVSSYFLLATWQDTAAIGSLPRSVNNLAIKDWEAWQKNFEEGNQERIDNGILTRIIGHDADNNKKVTIVTALSDTARAFAYYKSDALKKRREAAGVIGEPRRFIFHIVQRY